MDKRIVNRIETMNMARHQPASAEKRRKYPLRGLIPAYVFLVVLSLALAACGFQLRGHAAVPESMSRTRLVLPDENGDLGRALRPLLRSNGVELVEDPGEPAAQLTVLSDRMQRQILTVGAQTRVNEFQLNYKVRLTARDPEGNVLLPERELELNRDYTFDEASVLGKANEEALLREEMYREMARLILFHLAQASPRA